MNNDIRDRIFAAADSLYGQADHASFPTVDAVRKAARVNMNDASSGMKEWRRARMAQIEPVSVQVPESMQQSSNMALATLWSAAQDLASASLRSAQTAWDAERTELETLNKQMADAFELQAAEQDVMRGALADRNAERGQLLIEKLKLETELADARRELDTAQSLAAQSAVRTIEIERRAEELRIELDYAHQQAEQTRATLSDTLTEHAAEIVLLRNEAILADDHATMARNLALASAHQARESAALLRGQVDGLKEQNTELMRLMAGLKTMAEITGQS